MGLKKSERLEIATLREQNWSEADASFVLDRLEASGLSVAEFAREHGLFADRLWRWRRRMADVTTRADEGERISFAPVVLTGLGRSAVVVARVGVVEFEVVDPEKVDPRWLGELLEIAARVGGEAV